MYYTNLALMRGMFIAFAVATATNGTNRPISGDILCETCVYTYMLITLPIQVTNYTENTHIIVQPQLVFVLLTLAKLLRTRAAAVAPVVAAKNGTARSLYMCAWGGLVGCIWCVKDSSHLYVISLSPLRLV